MTEALPVANPLETTDGPELVFGLIGPVGTDLGLVREVLTKELEKVGYSTKRARVSSLLHPVTEYQQLAELEGGSEYERIKQHMEAGTDFRKQTERGDVLALMAVSEIRRIRARLNKDNDNVEKKPDEPVQRTAYIVDSLKHPREIEALRDIYGSGFMAIGAYSPRERRVEALSERIMASVHSSSRDAHRADAERLIKIDEDEEGEELGQNVSDAFPLSDCFVDTSDRAKVRPALERFIQLLFSHPYLTPTRDEYAMFHAQTAAIRSADLSRQVGAVISTKEGDIVAVGCNDVPKSGGGLYWCDDDPDGRDFQNGFDAGAKAKREVLAEILDKFRGSGWFSDKMAEKSVDDLVRDLLDGDHKNVLRETRITNLIEFGRAVHAEMAALSDAARRGVSIAGTTMFSTTFPCHLCARHIIASGVERVVFIEPYSKSKASELYSDSMEVRGAEAPADRVRFEPFVGIAPRQYMNLFPIRGRRKDNRGNTIDWGGIDQQPRLKRFVPSYILIEQNVEASLPELMKTAGLQLTQ